MPRRVRFGVFEVDLRTGEVHKSGAQRARLQDQPLQVLAALIERPGQLVTREELRLTLWSGDVHVDFERGLNKAVQKLREALGDTPNAPRFIETIPRRGYRFLAPVETASTAASAASEPPAVDDAGRWASRRALVASLVFATIAVTAFGLWVVLRQTVRPSHGRATPARSIAVMPLKNLSGDASDEYLSDGITEGLITALSRIDGLKVISRGSVFHLKGKDVDPRDVGRQLGVTAVLEGSLRRGRDSVRVAVRLVSTEDGRVLWAGDTNDRALGDIVRLQDEVARTVAAGLRLRLGPETDQRLVKDHTESVEAYHAYLKGRYFWNKRTGDGFRKAIAHFEHAIEKDPNYAPAYAGLADSYVLKRVFALLDPGETLEQMEGKAREAGERALEMDATLAEAHASLGLIKVLTENDEAGIERAYQRAIELNPNYATAHHWYALFLSDMGRFDEALREIRRAEEIDPLSLVINSDVALVFAQMRQYDRAIDHFKKTIEMDSNYPDAHAMLGWTYIFKGMYAEAIAEFQTARALLENPAAHLHGLIYAHSLSGNRKEALRIRDRLEMLSRVHGEQLSWTHWVLIHIALGENDKAFELLESAHRRGITIKPVLNHPSLDSLRSDPRFARLARQVSPAP